MNRREFLIGTAALSAAAGIGMQRAGAADGPRIKVGMLGGAHSHASGKIKMLRGMTAFDFAGVCEEDEKARAAVKDEAGAFLTKEELFARCEAVVVESAVRDHARDALAALEAGKHVHVEKPPAANLDDFDRIAAVARKKGRLLQVGYMWRFNPGFNAALEAAREGWLGDVFLVRATMNTQVAADRRPEWAEFNGGAMFEQGCHLIDPVVRLLGEPEEVTPVLGRHGKFSDSLADNCVAVLRYPRATAIITNSTLHPNAGPHRFLEILGTNGVATVKPIEQPVLHLDLARAAGPHKAGQQTIQFAPYRRYEGEFEEFASAIRTQRPLSVSLDEERRVQRTLLRACGALHTEFE